MKILPRWLANWQEVKIGINQSLNQIPHQNIQCDDHLPKTQPVLQWTNHSRFRSSSTAAESINALYSKEELKHQERCTSEEPDSKKRNHFMVDIEELKQKAEVRPDEAASPASPVEAANIFDLQKHILSTCKAESADKKCKEAFQLLESDISPSEQQVAAWSVYYLGTHLVRNSNSEQGQGEGRENCRRQRCPASAT
jgi:hypothetical protein